MTQGRQLMALAIQARERAYTPYSGFKVGAALLAKDGRTFLAATLKTLLTALLTVQNGLRFSKLYRKGYWTSPL